MLENLTSLEIIYVGCATFGGSLFVIWTVMMFMGVGDMDMDTDVSADGVGDADGMADTDASFKLLSFHGIMSFMMMFGLVGFAVIRNFGSDGGSILAASAAGFISVWIIGQIFASAKSLQSSGSLNMQNAVGAVGTVYLRVPAEGIGKVQITVQQHMKVYDGMSKTRKELDTGSKVKVLEVTSDGVLVVEKFN